MRRLSMLLMASLITSSTALVAGPTERADASFTAVARKRTVVQRWSNPRTWGGTIPKAGDQVRIPPGSKVRLDSSTPELSGLQVDGLLSFADKDLELRSDWIIVHGALRVGKVDDPYLHRGVITLTDGPRSDDIMGMGTKVLGVMGGTLEMHGRPVDGWTKLNETARPGDEVITLAQASPWRVGDEIVLASSDYWEHHDEERRITSISGTTVKLDQPLQYRHWGKIQSWGEHSVDERAEVGLLSRNLVVRGNDASNKDGFGGHMMIMEGAEARLDGVELINMGQSKALRRYPVHFHMDGNAPASYLRRSSIHHSFNRCVTIHGTNELTVADNVCYDHAGHGFFLEDGAERRNVITGNLGLGTHEVEDGLLPSDQRPATFWITNPNNVLEDNVAAGSDGFGFWYALPEHPTGLSSHQNIWPRRTPLGVFDDNTAHSNADTGLNVDDGPDADGNTDSTWYKPITDPQDPESAPVVARFERLTAYMNRDRGVWLRGENHVVSGAVLADNRAGATFASSETFLEDSFVVGETANPGTTESWEEAGFGGRALPLFWEPDAQIIGFEFYDGRVGVSNTTFAGFNSNTTRPAGALGYLAPNAFNIHPGNFAKDLEFIDSNRVYLAAPETGMDGDMSKVFADVDGSVTGTAGAKVAADNPFLLNPGCALRGPWNAHVCSSDYASLMVGTLTGEENDIKPLTLERADGATQTLMGCCDDSKEAHTTIIPNRTYKVGFNGGTPARSRFVLWNGRGHWVELVLPMDAAPTQVTRWGQPLTSVTSLSALASRTDSAYFYDAIAKELHVKVSGARSDWEEIRVVR
ncbi:MAG: transmembrane domain-containing protein [Actinomycetota bacterium]|nr:transmembrane domain-containing protein [Actinomycetota bacterium]